MKRLNFKKFKDILPKQSFKKHTTDTEFSSEYLDINPTDVVKDHVNFSEMTKIARRGLSRKYAKKK